MRFLGLTAITAIVAKSLKRKTQLADDIRQHRAYPCLREFRTWEPEMKKMAKLFVGKWTAVTKTEPMGGMPGGEAKGEATFYRGPGGLSLIEDFKSEGGGFGAFRGHGVSYWDDKAKNFTGMWCDSM